MADDTEEPPGKLDAMAERVIEGMRALGLPGNIAYDKDSERLLNESMEPFYLREIHAQLKNVPEDEREAWLKRTLEIFLDPPTAPQTWAEARDGILPRIRPRNAHACWSLQHQVEGRTIPPIPYAALTDHLLVELAWPVTEATVTINRDDLERWGVSANDALPHAVDNLRRMSTAKKSWQGSPEFPGVLRSPWNDRFDAARIVFAGEIVAGLEGPPVAVAMSDSCLYVADGDDEEALFNLGRAARKDLQQTGLCLWLRPLRLDPESGQWRHWLPKPGTASHGALKLMWASEDKAEYDAHGALLDRLFERERSPLRVGKIDVVQDPTGAGMTLTYWDDGPPQALPFADLIAFRRDGETLGVVPIAGVLKAMPDLIEERASYPIRYITRMFPEDWRLAQFKRSDPL